MSPMLASMGIRSNFRLRRDQKSYYHDRPVNTNTTAMLRKTCCAGKFPMQKLVTHHFAFADMPKAYDVFKNSAAEKAMKVVIDF